MKTLSILVITFVVLVVVYVEFLVKKTINEEEVLKYQKRLNEADQRINQKYDLNWNRDARSEMIHKQKIVKSFSLIFAGIFLAIVLFILAFTSVNLLPVDIAIICLSGIFLICYGLIKMAESKKRAIIVLAVTLILGSLVILFLTKYGY